MNYAIFDSILKTDELAKIDQLIFDLSSEFDSVESSEFAEKCKLLSANIPSSIRKTLYNFLLQKQTRGFHIIRGFLINEDSIGPTPDHWDASWKLKTVLRQEIYQMLISSCLGEVFGWLTQENGRLLRHIVPIKKNENEQLGGSSKVTLLWHIEEAFHSQRADMMSIMCYRNYEQAKTYVCSTSDMDIPERYWNILSEPRFYIKPDKSHMPVNNKSQFWQLNSEHFRKVKSFLKNPHPVAVLSGKKECARLLIDEAFMEPLENDNEAADALKWLYDHMYEKKYSIQMEPGDLLIIDNRITAHARSSYIPNYGPKARWLRRVNITTDLAKSHQWKESPYGRTIF